MGADSGIEAHRESARATVRLIAWTLAWLASLALARFGPGLLWGAQLPAASWAAVAVNLVAGAGWIVAFAVFLRRLDDLQRKIMLDALAITLGTGWVLGFGYVVAHAAGLISVDIDLAVFPALLGIVYVIAFTVGRIRYR